MNKILKKGLIELSYRTGRNFLPPQFLSLILTHRCNYRCPSCFNWQLKNYGELTAEQWLSAAKKIRSHFPADTFVEINGGEPLLKADLVYGLADILGGKFRLTINSNGSLINKQAAENLKTHDIDTVKLSLYSTDAETNDYLRGQAGSFSSAMSAIGFINDAGLNLELAVLITSKNIGQIPQLLDYAARLPKASIIFQPLDEKIESPESKNFIADNLQQDLWPAADQVRELFQHLESGNHKARIKNSTSQLELMKRYYLDRNGPLRTRCFSGQRMMVINPDGGCLLCFKGNTVGNISDSGIKDILSGQSANVERKKIKNCGKSCRLLGCNYYRGLNELLLR